MRNPGSSVVLENITKSYGDVRALDGISLSIGEGEVFGYIGPNGAGKTTTLKILVGLMSDYTGKLIVGGHDMPGGRFEANKTLGYMPQDVAFQEWRTVEHVLLTLGRLSGLTRPEIEGRMDRILDRVGLARERRKKITHLSGGMTQKLGLAQALLHDPELLVLDEPLAGLDPESRNQLKEIVRELGTSGKTVIFSSHILSDVQDVATRIGILDRGELLKTGTLEELKSQFSVTGQVEIVLSRDTDEWRDLAPIEGLQAIEKMSDRRLMLKTNPLKNQDDVVFNVLKGLLDAGCRIRSLAPFEPSLDEIYLEYLREGRVE